MAQTIKPTFTKSTGKMPNHAYLPQGISLHWNETYLICYKNNVKCFHSHICNKNDVKIALQDAIDWYYKP